MAIATTAGAGSIAAEPGWQPTQGKQRRDQTMHGTTETAKQQRKQHMNHDDSNNKRSRTGPQASQDTAALQHHHGPVVGQLTMRNRNLGYITMSVYSARRNARNAGGGGEEKEQQDPGSSSWQMKICIPEQDPRHYKHKCTHF